MKLPNNLPTSQKDKTRLGEFYDLHCNKQWFERAELVENHPTHMKKTLEVYANYNPLLEMKEILSFAQKYDYAVDVIDLSHK